MNAGPNDKSKYNLLCLFTRLITSFSIVSFFYTSFFVLFFLLFFFFFFCIYLPFFLIATLNIIGKGVN